MTKTRLEAFSDCVFSIIITIMVLELKVPRSAELSALQPLVPSFLSYLLSFVFLGIYWNNHHHLLQAACHVDGRVLWANLHLLFWLSLVPFTTSWMGSSEFAAGPAAVYGVVLLLAGVAYYLLARALIAREGPDSLLARAVGRDCKGIASLILYATAIPLAFAHPWIACAIYILVALIWLAPDPRIERTLPPDGDNCGSVGQS
jgi:uncharacterized membrane protein